jgi:hypothetical protein
MLSEAQIERYSRQILLPEVGGRGQLRLLAGRVAVAGDGPAAAFAATLLGRAGVGALDLVGLAGSLPELGPDCRLSRCTDDAAGDAEVVLDLTEDAARSARFAAARRPVVLGGRDGDGLRVATLVGRPCAACYPAAAPGVVDTGALAAAASLALGALAAGEALLALLEPPARGRVQVLSLGTGAVRTATLSPAAACAVCGGTA